MKKFFLFTLLLFFLGSELFEHSNIQAKPKKYKNEVEIDDEVEKDRGESKKRKPKNFNLEGKNSDRNKVKFEKDLGTEIAKIDKNIENLTKLVNKIKDPTDLPELYLRLAELYTEKARFVNFKAMEIANKKGLDLPDRSESLAVREEAVRIYNLIINSFPKYEYNDKILFFMGHEYKELDKQDKMLTTLEKLVEEYPKSEFYSDSCIILGNYYFDISMLENAETYFTKILDLGIPKLQNFARYKLAWVKINQNNYQDALQLFESVVLSPDEKDQVSNDIKREAIFDLILCYTEIRKAEDSLEYFKNLSESLVLYLAVLDKLANRYYNSSEFENAAIVYREIIRLSKNIDNNIKYSKRIFKHIKEFKNKINRDSVAVDVEAFIHNFKRYRNSWRFSEPEKVKLEKIVEVYTRAILTAIHIEAQKTNDKELLKIAAEGYKQYLDAFEGSEEYLTMNYNCGEAYYYADNWVDGGKQYEVIASLTRGEKSKEAMFTALIAYDKAFEEDVELVGIKLIEAREGFRRVARYFMKYFPDHERIPDIKYKLAKIFYNDREYSYAIEGFTKFIKQYPNHQRTPFAGHLALDCFIMQNDKKGLIKYGKWLINNKAIQDDAFKKEVADIVQNVEFKGILQGADGDDAKSRAKSFKKLAKKYGKSEMGEKALYNAFITYRNDSDFENMYEVGWQFIATYPESTLIEDIYTTAAKVAMDLTDFDKAAEFYEEYQKKFPRESSNQMLKNAALMRFYLGENDKAIEDYKILMGKYDAGEMIANQAYVYDRSGNLAGVKAVISGYSGGSSKGSFLIAYFSGLVNLKENNNEEALRDFKKAHNLYPKVALLLSGWEAEIPAKNLYHFGETLLAQYENFGFQDGEPVAVITKKFKLLQAVEQTFMEIMNMGSKKWAISGIAKIVKLYRSYAAFLDNAPSIPNIPKSDLDKKVEQLNKKSEEYAKTCVTQAYALKVYSDSVMECRGSEAPSKNFKPNRKLPDDSEIVKRSKKVLKDNPKNAKALNDLTMYYIFKSDLGKAEFSALKAIEIEGSNPDAYNNLGIIQTLKGEEDEAFLNFEKALELNPRFPEAKINKATIMKRYGNIKEAAKLLKSVKEAQSYIDLVNVHPDAKNQFD